MDSSSDNNNTAMDHQLRQTPAEHPVQCAGGCGFFGTAENNWLCSKCYGNYIKEKIIQSHAQLERVRVDQQVLAISEEFKKSVTISDETNETVVNSAASPVVVAKTNNRCGCCNKKVGLLGFKCRCGGDFCGRHRYPEAHMCDIDYKKAGRIAIEKENPVVKADKIIRIV